MYVVRPRWMGVYAGLLAVSLAVSIGAATAYAPRVGVAVCSALLAGLLAAPFVQRAEQVFFASLALLLAGYAFAGRGFAYLGAPPLYVGELVLVLGTGALIVGLRRLRLSGLHALIIGFMAYGLARTLPFIPIYGIDAVRDAALWIYALYALVLSTLVQRRHIERFVALYGQLTPAFVIWTPIAAAISLGWLHVPAPLSRYLYFKGGDMGVHLAGAGAFMLVGLYATRRRGLLAETSVWPFWFVAVAVAGTINRGGLLAVGVGLLAVFALRGARNWFPFIAVALTLLVGAAVVNPTVAIGEGKTLSIGQVTSNLISVVAPSDEVPQRLAGTREWRLQWWGKIIDYTVHGPYFWTGKGFGVNLGLSDRISVQEAVRSPHNSHMTVLARMGVPALVLWVTLWLAFATTLVRRIRAAQRSGDAVFAAVGIWMLALWLAMMTNTSFDVYLEGPQGGIWFWSVVGFALALCRIGAADASATTPPAPAARGPHARSQRS
jgi:hypothetical protein